MLFGGPFWIDASGPRIATMSCPRGGGHLGGELHGLKRMGVDVMVSFLEPHEVVKLELEAAPSMSKAAGIEFLNFPIRDHSIPSSPVEAVQFAKRVARLLDTKSVVMHCYAGIGRSSLMAACVLIARGISVDEAFLRISIARGIIVPDTKEQLDWVTEQVSSLCAEPVP